MTIERIKELRKLCSENYQFISNKNLFRIVIKDRDIDGGINFEEEVEYYMVGDNCWLCFHVIEKTIQPAFGQTITSERDKSTASISDEKLLEVLNKNLDALKSFEEYARDIVDRFCCKK